MAFRTYDANFISVLPTMRASEDILADITLAGSGRATDLHKAEVARVELLIKNGDALYRSRQYEPALAKFRQARGEIYSMLYPGFDVGAHLYQKDIALPVSKALENGMLTYSGNKANAIRPTELESRSRLRVNPGEPIPASLTRFTQTGFREMVTGDETLQSAAAEGVALLNDNKPEGAIDVMLDALAQTGTNQRPDVALTAALHLNLATAYLQTSDVGRAKEMANVALKLFSCVQRPGRPGAGVSCLGCRGATERGCRRSQAALRPGRRDAEGSNGHNPIDRTFAWSNTRSGTARRRSFDFRLPGWSGCRTGEDSSAESRNCHNCRKLAHCHCTGVSRYGCPAAHRQYGFQDSDVACAGPR